MSDNYKIYVDASRPATLNDGAGALTDCATLQEACSQCTGFTVHRYVCARAVAPDPRRSKSDKQPKNDCQAHENEKLGSRLQTGWQARRGMPPCGVVLLL